MNSTANYAARKQNQFSIARLLVWVTVCGLACRVWPWHLGTTMTQVALIVWLSLTILNSWLFQRIVGTLSSETSSLRRTVVFVCCLLPIVNWLVLMTMLILQESFGNAEFMLIFSSLFVPITFVSIASVIVLPIYLFVSGLNQQHRMGWLCFVAWMNYFPPVIVLFSVG